MFSIDQIKTAHAKVKSGADFPRYIQEIIQLGVTGYKTFVTDGHTVFQGERGFEVQSPTKYAGLAIANESDKSQFQKDLKAHQQGESDYLSFCASCARLGIEKWVVDTAKMTCTYFDKAGGEVLVEAIPAG